MDLLTILEGDFGPVVVFVLLLLTGVGVPLGEDFVTIPAGVLIGEGSMAFWPTAVLAYAGVLLADFTWYGLCSRYGTRLLHRRWFKRVVHPRRLLEVKHQIEERGVWVIVASRFIPGSRTPAITAAGVLHMRFWKFAAVESVCCLFTIPLQLGLGMAIAKGLGTKETAGLVQSLIGAVVLILALMFALAAWRRFKSRRQRPKRAKAVWLRRFRRHARSGGAGAPRASNTSKPRNQPTG